MGIDPVRDPIPVAPAEHYHMGGISVDATGRSSLDSLWACGEVTSTGAHGANRLASNSLLEAIVYGARIADDIDGRELPAIEGKIAAPKLSGKDPSPAALVTVLRRLMTDCVGVIRNGEGIAHALGEIARLEAAAGEISIFTNMTTTARLIAAAAYAREESRGGHFRSDFPEPREAWRHRTFITLAEANQIAAEAMTQSRKASAQA